jgi:hypothetical protein
MDNTEALAKLKELREQKAELAKAEKQIVEQLALKYADQLAGQYGTVYIDGIKFSVPKQVKWDQEKLAAMWEKISLTNEDPFEYMTVERHVPESRYKAWPEFIKEQFEPARTVTTGNVTIKLED